MTCPWPWELRAPRGHTPPRGLAKSSPVPCPPFRFRVDEGVWGHRVGGYRGKLVPGLVSPSGFLLSQGLH